MVGMTCYCGVDVVFVVWWVFGGGHGGHGGGGVGPFVFQHLCAFCVLVYIIVRQAPYYSLIFLFHLFLQTCCAVFSACIPILWAGLVF